MPDMPPADNTDESGVLRPFVDHPHDPLPPVVPPEFAAPVQPAPAQSAPPQPTPAQQAPAQPSPRFQPPPSQPVQPQMTQPLAPAQAPAAAPRQQPPTAPAPSNEGTIAISKTTLAIIGSVAAVIIAALVFLWQTSGSDGSSAEPVNPEPTPTTVAEATGDTEATTTAAPTTTIANTVDGLTAQLEEARAALAAAPAPALPGASLQRVVVSAEASFVSASDGSVAVVGPFGNFANIDPSTNAVVAAGQVAPGATRVIRTPSSVWITDYHDSKLIWLNPATNVVTQTFDFPGPDGLAKDGKSLVISSFDNHVVTRFDPAVGKVVEQVDVGGNPTAVAVGPQGGIWAAVFDTGELVRIDPATFTITDRIPVGSGPVGIALSQGTVWVANHDEGTVAQVSMAERTVVSTIPVGAGPTELLVDSGSLWVTSTDAGDLLQIDVATGNVVTRTPLGGVARGGGPTGISAGAGSIWVAIEGEQSVVRITPPA